MDTKDIAAFALELIGPSDAGNDDALKMRLKQFDTAFDRLCEAEKRHTTLSTPHYLEPVPASEIA